MISIRCHTKIILCSDQLKLEKSNREEQTRGLQVHKMFPQNHERQKSRFIYVYINIIDIIYETIKK